MLEIDTGARGLIVSGISGAGLEHLSTQGVEPLYGVGAGDNLPPSNFIRQTRRVAVQSVTLGGVTVEEPIDATWINFQSGGPQLGPQGMPGLIGHRILDGYNAHFDFSNQRFALTESTRKPEHHDVHEVSLAQLKHAKTANDLIKKARIQVWMEDEKGAQKTLQQFHDKAPSDPRGQILQSRLVRNSGDHAGALAILLELPVEDLVHERELIGVVNALWLTDESERAGQLALSATQSVPKAPNAWVALSDHHRYAGNLAESRQAINKANRLDENPDGHLLRRAWTASMEDDLFGAMTHLRRLLDLYPSGGVTLFFYHHIVSGTGHMPLLLEDVDRARARLHPGDGPLDFFSSTYRALGEDQLARTLMEEGRTRDCRTDLETYVRANCEAWYLALANEELELAQQNAETAVRLKPHRADFLDTLAMVQEARGDLEAAHNAANKAATMVPDDIYLLWQAARLNDALQKKQAG